MVRSYKWILSYHFLPFVLNVRLWFLWWFSFLSSSSIEECPIVLYQPTSRRIAVALCLESLKAGSTWKDVRTKHDGEGDRCHFVLVRVLGHPGKVLDQVVEHVVVCGW